MTAEMMAAKRSRRPRDDRLAIMEAERVCLWRGGGRDKRREENGPRSEGRLEIGNLARRRRHLGGHSNEGGGEPLRNPSSGHLRRQTKAQQITKWTSAREDAQRWWGGWFVGHSKKKRVLGYPDCRAPTSWSSDFPICDVNWPARWR